VSLTARLNFETNKFLEVDAPVDPVTDDPNLGGATEGNDYLDSGETWEFTATDPPEDTKDVFEVLTDNNPEDTELLEVTTANLPPEIALGDTTRFEYSIIDNDSSPKIEFASSNPTSVTEGNTTVTFNVETQSSSGSGTAFFNITGDAVAGEDYEITSASTSDTTRGDVSLSSGSASFDITILDDNLSEASENLDIELYAAKNATLVNGGNLSETLTINDDEGVPSVSFTSDSYSGQEGTNVGVTLSLSTSAGQDLDVKVQDDGTGDASGSDYDFSSPKIVTIPSGNRTKTFSVTLLGDGAVEVTETIDLSIVGDGDTDPTVTTPDATTISILDNSAPGKVGPGGVGSADEISLWLRPDEGVTTGSNGAVSTWADQSGNGNDATQTNSGERPAYGSTAINGIDVVTFDGTDDFLRSNVASLPNSTNTLLSVANAGGGGVIFGVDNGSFESLRTLGYDNGSTGAASQNRVTNGNTVIGSGNAGGIAVLSSVFNNSKVNIRENGGGANSLSAGPNSNGTYAILGGEPKNGGDQQDPDLTSGQNTFGGDVAEFIAYDQTLNKAQRLIVENYLAAKYSINSLSTDLYAGDLGADGTDGTADDRDRDVIGIGQASDGTKHVTAQGGGFTLSLAGGNDNGDFVFAGRKTGVTERINITDTSTVGNIGVTARINEDRYLDITGALDVDITFDFSDSDIVGPAGDPANYVLLRRSGTSGDWTKVTAGASFSSERVTFTNLSLTDSDDGYFTIGTTDSDDSPLDTRYITIRGDRGPGNDDGYYHFSAPVDASESATYSDLVKPDGSQVIDFTSGNPNPFASEMAYVWNGGDQTWTAVGASTSLTTGKGFTMWLDDTNATDRGDSGKNYRIDPEYTFGLTNGLSFETDNKDVNVPTCGSCSNPEFYLLGNPYIQGFNLKGLNLDVGAPDFQQTVFVWNNRQSTYETKSRTADDKISRWQSFWVERATQGAGATTLTFDKTGRVSSLVPYVGSKAETEAETDTEDWARIALALTAENDGEILSTDKAAVLFFHESAAEGWDPYDLSKFANSGATLAPLGSGREGAEIPKAQESRYINPEDSFTVDLQFNERDVDGTFEITPHQWDRIPSTWAITLIDTKGTASSDDDEQVPLEASTTYQFDASSESKTQKAGETGPDQHSLPSAKRMEKASGTPRFRLKVEPNSGALPVEFASIEAVAEKKDAVLKWKTGSETGNAGFEVQHKFESESTDQYTKVGFVEGAGTTTEPQNYQYRVQDLDYGEHVFRLRPMDQNDQDSKKASLSKEARVQIRLNEAYTVKAPYPNPFREQVTLKFTVREAQDVRVALYDVLGRKVRRVYNQRVPGNETQSIRMRGKRLASGIYFLRIRGEDFSEVQKVVHME